MISWPLSRPPKDVQRAAFEFGRDRRGVGYFLEQGLGKTDLAIADFLYHLQLDHVDALCVIAPNYLKSGWRDIVNDELGLDIPVITWPNQVNRDVASLPHIFVINCESLIYSGGVYLAEILNTHRRYMLVLDESDLIKNFKASVTKKVMELKSFCEYWRALSGTPMTEAVMDLWPQLRFIGAISGVNPYQFRNRYAVMGGYMMKKVVGAKNSDELQAILDECVFRALKEDWWKDMPAKLWPSPLEFEMTPRQLKDYKTMLNEFYVEVGNDEGVFVEQAVNKMDKLQQISRGYIIDGENDRTIELVEPKNNPALKVMLEFLGRMPRKVIIATQHRYCTDMVERALAPMGAVTLRGGMSEHEIADVKREFNNNPKIRYLVGQMSVAQRGHTLLGQAGEDRCVGVFFFENVYSRRTRSQMEDRPHRWGQDSAVSYWDLFGSKEDKRMVVALQKKQDLITAVLDAVRRK